MLGYQQQVEGIYNMNTLTQEVICLSQQTFLWTILFLRMHFNLRILYLKFSIQYFQCGRWQVPESGYSASKEGYWWMCSEQSVVGVQFRNCKGGGGSGRLRSEGSLGKSDLGSDVRGKCLWSLPRERRSPSISLCFQLEWLVKRLASYNGNWGKWQNTFGENISWLDCDLCEVLQGNLHWRGGTQWPMRKSSWPRRISHSSGCHRNMRP